MSAEPPLIRFRRAAAALSARPEPGLDADGRVLAAEAAAALVALATSGTEANALDDTLRPDPAGDRVAWTVCCYQIGDLSPSALRDFAAAGPAVRTLSGCSDPTHVAAELLASTANGLTWTAMTRLGDDLTFQLFAEGTARDSSEGVDGEWADAPGGSSGEQAVFDEARDRWRQLLAGWARDPYAGVRAPAAAQSSSSTSSSVPLEVRLRLDAVEAQIAALAEQLRELRAAQLDHRITP